MALLEWRDGFSYALELDVSETETYEATAEVSEHSVERGAPVADHIRRGTGTVTIEGMITNAPLVAKAPTLDQRQVQQSLPVPGIGSLTVLGWAQAFDRVRLCDELLEQLMDAAVPVRLTTSLRAMEDLAVTRARVERGGGLDAIMVTLELRSLRFATTQRASVTPPDPAQRRGQPTQNRGAQPTTAQRRTMLTNIVNRLTS